MINQLIQSMMQRLPQCRNRDMVNNFLNLYQNNDEKGLEEMAQNILNSNNMTLEQAQQRILGSFRR